MRRRSKDAVTNATPAVSHCNSTETATTAAVHESDDNCVVVCYPQRRSYLFPFYNATQQSTGAASSRGLTAHRAVVATSRAISFGYLGLSLTATVKTKIETAIANSASALTCRLTAQVLTRSYDAGVVCCRAANKAHAIRLTLCILRSGTFVVTTAVARLCSQSETRRSTMRFLKDMLRPS